AEDPAAEQSPDVTERARRISPVHEPGPLDWPTNVNMHGPRKSFQYSSKKKRKRLAHFHRMIATARLGQLDPDIDQFRFLSPGQGLAQRGRGYGLLPGWDRFPGRGRGSSAWARSRLMFDSSEED